MRWLLTLKTISDSWILCLLFWDEIALQRSCWGRLQMCFQPTRAHFLVSSSSSLICSISTLRIWSIRSKRRWRKARYSLLRYKMCWEISRRKWISLALILECLLQRRFRVKKRRHRKSQISKTAQTLAKSTQLCLKASDLASRPYLLTKDWSFCLTAMLKMQAQAVKPS